MENFTNPVFQTQKHESLKDTYQFASTQQLIETLAPHGWYPSETKFGKARSKTKDGFQRHIVRLQNDSFLEIPGLSQDNKSRPEIIVMNSHDGSTALRMMLGMIRIACLNGVIAGTGLREFRAIHSGNLGQKLSEGIEYMTGGLPQMIESVQKLQNTKFSPENLELLVKTLVDERLAKANVVEVDYRSALAVRRNEDKAEDAFTVFNRLQETLIRGGIKYQAVRNTLNDQGEVIATEVRNATTRKLASIPQAVRLNTMAYDLATKLAA